MSHAPLSFEDASQPWCHQLPSTISAQSRAIAPLPDEFVSPNLTVSAGFREMFTDDPSDTSELLSLYSRPEPYITQYKTLRNVPEEYEDLNEQNRGDSSLEFSMYGNNWYGL